MGNPPSLPPAARLHGIDGREAVASAMAPSARRGPGPARPTAARGAPRSCPAVHCGGSRMSIPEKETLAGLKLLVALAKADGSLTAQERDAFAESLEGSKL